MHEAELRNRTADLQRHALIKKSSAQGYPMKGFTDGEAVKFLENQARGALISLAKTLMPWHAWDTAEEELREETLRQGVPALMEAWYAYFEPENLEAYRERQAVIDSGK